MQQFKQTILPRWRGFNLVDGFGKKYAGFFNEEDFQIISDFGFDFVRLPLNYTLWINNDDPFDIDDEKISFVDQAVLLGEKYGIHVNIAFHRGPGYSVATDRVEPFDLWKDKEALDAFKLHWVTFAKRYKSYGNDKVSFNLLNEPAKISPEAHTYVMRQTVAAIREVDSERLIILDGLNWANIPLPDLGYMGADNVAQSCRGYLPGGISHFGGDYFTKENGFPEPEWPGGFDGTIYWDKERLYKHYSAWAALSEIYGFGVHCGEGGCYINTPHDVALRWLDDLLDVLKSCNIGFALWNLHKHFGIFDTDRPDVEYEDYRGRKLDRKMLEVLQKY